MLGFGALRAMNDSIKSNRELLKAGKNSIYDQDLKYPLSTGHIVFREKSYKAEALKVVRAKALRNSRLEKIRAIVILLVSTGITLSLIVYLWTYS